MVRGKQTGSFYRAGSQNSPEIPPIKFSSIVLLPLNTSWHFIPWQSTSLHESRFLRSAAHTEPYIRSGGKASREEHKWERLLSERQASALAPCRSRQACAHFHLRTVSKGKPDINASALGSGATRPLSRGTSFLAAPAKPFSTKGGARVNALLAARALLAHFRRAEDETLLLAQDRDSGRKPNDALLTHSTRQCRRLFFHP